MFMSELNRLAAEQHFARRRDIPTEDNYRENSRFGKMRIRNGEKPERAKIGSPAHEEWRRDRGLDYSKGNR